MKIGFWILFFSIINLIFAYAKNINAIPCKILENEKLVWGLCALDPTVTEKTLYFGAGWLDSIYLNIIWPLLFFGIVAFLLPYTLACSVIAMWHKYIKKDSSW